MRARAISTIVVNCMELTISAVAVCHELYIAIIYIYNRISIIHEKHVVAIMR